MPNDPLPSADSSSALAWTGERFIPGEGGEALALEHFHRYEVAKRFCAGKRVLDLGCGEGYGARSLQTAGASLVVGVDIAFAAVRNTTEKSGRSVMGAISDAARLPLADGSVDVVVCFEVIEHVSDPGLLVAEVRRVLALGGTFLVSTPNKSVYNRGSTAPNPYHLCEMELDEFRLLLNSRFEHVKVFGQQVVATSLVWPVDAAVNPAGTLHTLPGKDPPYVVAVCRDRPPIDMEWSAFTAWTHDAMTREANARAYIEELEETVTGLRSVNLAAAEREQRAAEQLQRDRCEIEALKQTIARLNV